MRDGLVCSPADLLSCTRAGSAQAPNKSGVLLPFSENELRITDRGLLVEEQRQNLLLHSFTPTAQTVSLAAGDYVLSVLGTGTALVSGQAVGTATEALPFSFTLPTPGDVLITPDAGLMFYQLEQGLFATSPISSGATPATRAPDTVSFHDASWFNPQNCTLFVEWEQVAPAEYAQNGVQILVRWRSEQVYSRVRSGGRVIGQIKDDSNVLIFNNGSTGTAPLGVHTAVLALAPHDMSIAWSASVDGSGGVINDTSGTPTSNTTEMTVGGSGGGEFLNGCVRRLVYWAQRLPNSQVENLV